MSEKSEKSENLIEEYKGYKIWRHVRVEFITPLSAYTCSVNVPTKRLYIAGPGASVNQFFYKVEKAREHIDFLIFSKNFKKTVDSPRHS